jgi:hypothetical protein
MICLRQRSADLGAEEGRGGGRGRRGGREGRRQKPWRGGGWRAATTVYREIISVAKNTVLHSKTKHIEVRFHFLCDHYEKGDIDLHHIDIQN